MISGGNNFHDFLTINWPNFVYLLVDPGFLPLPLKFLWSIALRPHTAASICPFVY